MSLNMLPKRVFAKNLGMVLLSCGLFTGCVHKKYDTPITKNTQQPDKVLFDSAMKDIEHGRYEVARISLQTLMNTYDSSEYMAKAKLAIADSWFREGGSNGLAQAEAEYKDFQLFYPGMEESPQAQSRICDIHFKQMDKSDRDMIQTLRAEDECKAVIVQYPNSKFVPDATQKLRAIQESEAAHEFFVGHFYGQRQMNPAAANRLNALVDQYPLYSGAGEALYEAGDAYAKMGPRFRKQAGEMFARIVSDYPLSDRAKDATERLKDMELPVPPVNQAALERAKWEKENYHKAGMMATATGLLKGGPDISHAAKSGAPTMSDPKRTMPASIPVVNNDAAAGTNGTGTTEVSVSNPTDNALDKKADARNANGPAVTPAPAAAPAVNAPLPTNRDAELKKYRDLQAKKQAKLEKKKKKKSTDDTTSPAAAPASATPAAATPPATAPNATKPQQ
jgi:outer membrane protein assembly factor BamD